VDGNIILIHSYMLLNTVFVIAFLASIHIFDSLMINYSKTIPFSADLEKSRVLHETDITFVRRSKWRKWNNFEIDGRE
jgi:hypothetical protein